MINKKILLISILILAAVLRFYRLDEYPALNADEAAIGYNAYSLLETGLDEHGNAWPIHFQSFNDYKPGLYFYLLLPFVKFLGLNEWAVRIPGALLGVGTVLIIYLLVNQLSLKSKVKSQLSIVASFLLAISPWHLHFSRGGWEVSAATFFITLGTWLFIKATKKSKYYWLSAISYALSLYTYHAARVVVPLIILAFSVIYFNKLLKDWKPVLLSVGVGLLLLTPLLFVIFGPAGFARSEGVSIFADQGTIARINEQVGEHGQNNSFYPRLIHNKLVNYSLAFLNNWGKHFWGEFLFLSGDEIQRNRVPETGQMYLFESVFLLVGLFAIVCSKNIRAFLPILIWLLVAPTAAAFTFQSPHALRAHNMVIPLTIISAYGLVTIINEICDVRYEIRIVPYVLLIAIIGWSFARYLHMYWVHMAKEYPFSSQYGVKELVSYIQDDSEEYNKIIVTDRYDQPYILFLFYLNYPPEKFQNSHVLTDKDDFGFSTVRSFANFEFRSVDYEEDKNLCENCLIIGTDEDIPDRENVNLIEEIYGINGYKYFQIVAN